MHQLALLIIAGVVVNYWLQDPHALPPSIFYLQIVLLVVGSCLYLARKLRKQRSTLNAWQTADYPEEKRPLLVTQV